MSTSYVAFIGFVMMFIIIYLLLKQKVSTMFAFSVIPIVSAFLVGMTPTALGSALEKGLGMTTPVSLIMLFSLPYFMMMADTGLFNELVRKIVRHVKITPPVLTCLTIVVAMIVGMDVSITSIYIIAIPLLLPFYRKLHMSPMLLMFLTTLGVINTFDVPWSARMLRAASLVPDVKGGPIALFSKMLPTQIVFTIVLFALAVILGLRIQHKNKTNGEIDNDELEDDSQSTDSIQDDPELARPKMFWINVLFTIFLVICLVVFPTIPSYYIFAFGLVVAFAYNYPDLKMQSKLLKKYSRSLMPVMPTILLSGVVVGVMEYSGMMKAMVDILLKIIPSSLGPWLYIIIALVGVPLMFLFTNDTWYYVMLPIVISIMKAYNIPGEIVVVTLFMNMGAMLTPIAQPQIYIGANMTGDVITIPQFIKKSFLPIWGLSIVWTVIGLLMGAFR